MRNSIPTTTVHTHTTTPVGHERGGTPPAAGHQPADAGAGQKRPRGLGDAGDGEALGVAAPADRAEHHDADDVGDKRECDRPGAHVTIRSA